MIPAIWILYAIIFGSVTFTMYTLIPMIVIAVGTAAVSVAAWRRSPYYGTAVIAVSIAIAAICTILVV